MKPPVPLPMTRPFLTFYTPTYRRPEALARCLRSVAVQTHRNVVEQIVLPDHAGYGLVGGLFGRIPWYANACRGQYVHILCDDDVLADEGVVAKVQAFAIKTHFPEVIVVRVRKGALELPANPGAAPEQGQIDLASYVLRQDIWQAHAEDYGDRYEGDFDHAKVLWAKGYRHEYLPELCVVGGQSHGRPEVDWP